MHTLSWYLLPTRPQSLVKIHFRRDQIWFASREGVAGTELTPLSDYSVRKDSEDLERYYLEGRYGAIPYIPHFSDIASSMGG